MTYDLSRFKKLRHTTMKPHCPKSAQKNMSYWIGTKSLVTIEVKLLNFRASRKSATKVASSFSRFPLIIPLVALFSPVAVHTLRLLSCLQSLKQKNTCQFLKTLLTICHNPRHLKNSSLLRFIQLYKVLGKFCYHRLVFCRLLRRKRVVDKTFVAHRKYLRKLADYRKRRLQLKLFVFYECLSRNAEFFRKLYLRVPVLLPKQFYNRFHYSASDGSRSSEATPSIKFVTTELICNAF